MELRIQTPKANEIAKNEYDNSIFINSNNEILDVISNITKLENESVDDIYEPSSVTTLKYMPNDYIEHIALDKIPRNTEAEYNALKASIEETKTLLEPILVIGNLIIDGRDRLKCCIELNIQPIFREYECDTDNSSIEALHIHRRNLNSSQKAILAYNSILSQNINDVIRNFHFNPKIETKQSNDKREKASKKYSVSTGYISLAKTIHETSTQLYNLVFEGKIEFKDAKRILSFKKNSKEFYNELIENIDHYEAIKDCRNIYELDKNLYNSVKSNKISKETADKLTKIAKLDMDEYKKINLDNIDANEIKIIHEGLTNTNKQSIIENIDIENSNIQNTNEYNSEFKFRDEFILSQNMQERIIKLATKNHQSLDDLLALMIETYENNLTKINEGKL